MPNHPFDPDSRPDSDPLAQPLAHPINLPEGDPRGFVPFNNLSRHMRYLRRKSQSRYPWHLVAVVFGGLLALGMAGYFSR